MTRCVCAGLDTASLSSQLRAGAGGSRAAFNRSIAGKHHKWGSDAIALCGGWACGFPVAAVCYHELLPSLTALFSIVGAWIKAGWFASSVRCTCLP